MIGAPPCQAFSTAGKRRGAGDVRGLLMWQYLWYLEAMRHWGAQRGKEAGVAYAEGFRQHLGHSYPQDNLLGQVLGTV